MYIQFQVLDGKFLSFKYHEHVDTLVRNLDGQVASLYRN
jgi:hypothetical protein